jgi:hypothetical protein
MMPTGRYVVQCVRGERDLSHDKPTAPGAVARELSADRFRPVSVVVPVAFVRGVPMAVVQIVDVVAVQDALVSAALAVPVLVVLVRGVPVRFALVPVAAVFAVQMPVVRVVDVIPVRHLRVSAVGAVGVGVGGVFQVKGGHGGSPSGECW